MIKKTEEILLSNNALFGNDDEHIYNGVFRDGKAVCIPEEDSDPFVVLEYPKLDEVLNDKAMSDEIIRYCGLYDLTPSDLTPYDVALCYGTPKAI